MSEIDDITQVQNERKAERHQHVGDIEQDNVRHLPPFASRPITLRRSNPIAIADCIAASLPYYEMDSPRIQTQVGCTILQPVSATEPAASSPGTRAATVNTSSAPDLGVWTLPTKMFGISS